MDAHERTRDYVTEEEFLALEGADFGPAGI
jgi:hypothetical protein